MAVFARRFLRVLALTLLALGLFGCDEATKTAAKASLGAGGAIDVVHGAVELRYVENTDIAFNAFRLLGLAHSPALLAGLAIGGVIGALVFAMKAQSWAARIGLTLIVGGALGNVADRIARGYVVDFIHVRGWPVFNVADIAVCVGVGLLVLMRFVRKRVIASPEA